jgi:hypothetical protein
MSSAFRWPEGRRVAGMWRNSFYVVMWCWRSAWPGLGGGGSTGRRRGRAAVEARAHWRSGPIVPVHEGEIGRAGEHQWVTGMLFVHWIRDGRRRGQLSTAARGRGGGPARGYAREEKMLWTRGARVSKEDHRATAEHVLRPGEALRARAGAGDAGGTRGGSGGGGATWRGGSRPARGRGAVARVLGWHVAQLKATWGWWVCGTWPASRG